ncbi:DegV family protein [Anoxynatronum buryatiense]|uniref:EDD domain protein, DegV family n=1 Tax=Anoxynatronum buryatiense TaxID=489973 RepID=A0AA46AH97_9CLOT|nr:DegV family protein [Anoxynatronum buryatiense]SMP38102.1 EDD domain protein, DegV family [Anoxynatronum buryatiense]
MSIQVITDSTAYLPETLVKKYAIQVIPLSVHFGETVFQEDVISHHDFYQRMKADPIWPTSSQPPVEGFVKSFEACIQKGWAVLGIFISSDMSGTYQSALLASRIVREKYPQAQIKLIDSRTNCMQMGFAALEAARGIADGLSLDTVHHQAAGFIRKSRFIFAPKTLDHLKKGGRIGAASAFLGSMLRIVPLLTVENGKTAVLHKVRTQKKALQAMTHLLLDDFSKFGKGNVAVHHINDETAGTELASVLEKEINQEVPVVPIGPVIGLHVGPGTVGIAYHTLKDRL